MKIAMVYIYPESGAHHHLDRAIKFVHSYQRFPPGMDHDSVVVCNGSPLNDQTRFLFGSLPNLTFIEHDDSGFDIGGYQKAAREYPADLMVFFGGNAYLRGPDWLVYMVNAWNTYGDTLYGSTGNTGDKRFNVYPHVRTTGFWMSRELFNACPLKVTHNGLRYEFEHGASGLTSWIIKQKKQPYIVAWTGVYPLAECNRIPNGFRTGDGSNVLVGDRLTESPYGSDPPG